MADSVMELAVKISAIDYFTHPLRSMVSSISGADSKIKGLNNTLKLMGKSRSEIDAINSSLQKMADKKAFSNIANDLQKIGTAKSDIAAMESSYMRMSQYQRDMASVQDRMNRGKSSIMSGVAMVAAGGGSLAGLTKLADQAGQIQMQGIQLGGIYGYGSNSKQIQAIQKQAQSLSTKTLFSQSDLMGISMELAHAGLSYSALKKTVPQATYLAEMEVGMGKSADAKSTAYNFARMVDDAGISNNTKKMSSFADQMYRVINVTHASSESLGETFKYAMPVVKQLGWNQNDLLLASAVAARSGMEGSMAGTNIKDFTQRINPYKFLNTKGGDKQLQAMMDAGLISGVTYAKNKKGQNTNHIIGFNNAALLADKNHIKGYGDMVKILSAKHDTYIKSGHGELQWSALMNHIFGEQGQTFALTSKKDTAGKVTNQINSQQSLEKQIKKIRQSYAGQMHVFKSNFGTIGTQLGADIMQKLTPALKKANDLLGKFIGFLQKNPKAGKIFADVALGVSSFLMLGGSLKIVSGALKLALGGFKMFKLKNAAGEATMLSKALKGVGSAVKKAGPALKSIGKAGSSAFKFLGKGTVSGITKLASGMKLLGKNSLSVIKTIGKFGGALGKLGIQAAKWAIQMAADWLIAMGPIGWIIMGVTAIIAAAVIAWKTNFLGFRDKLSAVWNTVKTDAGKVWDWIKQKANGFVSWFKDLPGKFEKFGSDMMNGLVNGIKNTIGKVTGAISGVAKSVVGGFKSLLGINSPSKVFMEHGKFIVQGLSMGINKNSGMAHKSTMNLANGVNQSFNSKGGLSLAGSGNVEIHIHPHPHQRAEDIADMVVKKLGKSSRRSMMNTGTSVNMGAF